MKGYEDPRVAARNDGLTLRWYYFPLGSKRIPWKRIVKVQEHDMGTGITGGRWRIWGSGDLVHWMPLDVQRPKKKWMYVFHLEGTHIRPCVTPDDPDAFKAALAERGIELSSDGVVYED